MEQRPGEISRRAFLKRATAVSVGSIAARGFYEVLDELAGGPNAAYAGPVRRREEQYLVDNVEVIIDNGVTLAVPPLHNDVITARLRARTSWTVRNLKAAQSRLASALATVEKPYSSTAAGLTMVVGWGLPYFRNYLPASVSSYLPVDTTLSQQTGTRQLAILDSIRFPSDPDDVLLESNDVVFKLRSNSQDILRKVERALFDDTAGSAYVGDLFDLTSKRIGFLGRGFGTRSIAKQLALAAQVPGAELIPDDAQLMLGFTSTQTAALGPDNIVSFETLPGVTNQFPNGYFAGGCAMHLSHLHEDLEQWYGGNDYNARVARMFSPRTSAAPDTVTLPNGPAEVSSAQQVKDDAASGVVGHNSTLQQVTRLARDVTDNYGRLRRAGTAIPLREDFNTIDNPFAWSADPAADRMAATAAAGMHFVAFIPASHRFHLARLAMDGVFPDGTDLRSAEYNITSRDNGINAALRTTHRQNFLVPPRRRRSFPLVELLG
ncbi:MAG TPA: hypothetical protein VEZ46_15525 [Mycobacteriales bacterium]|jgi:hypothetical protein|nr:hypothetical protein [Mycobacteriales bacterium]